MSDSAPQQPSARQTLAEAVFRKYRPELHRWLVRRLRSPDSADDVAQEVFTRALRIEHPEYVRNPLAYLFGIAFHVISEYQIREDNERLVGFDSRSFEQLTNDTTRAIPDDFPERLSLQRQLEKALMELPQQYRAVLLLCKRDGMTYEEAAAACGLSVHTVEKYLVRAKAMLMALSWDR